jgi:hypothetical protein
MQYTTRCAYQNNIYTYVLRVDRADPLLSAILTGHGWAILAQKKEGTEVPSKLAGFFDYPAPWTNLDYEVWVIGFYTAIALKVCIVVKAWIHSLVIQPAPQRKFDSLNVLEVFGFANAI